MKRTFLLLLAILISMTVDANIDYYKFDNLNQKIQFKKLNNILRCPQCPNNSIHTSNSEIAKDLRKKVYKMIIEGKSNQEILDYMVVRYGNFITYDPPLTWATFLLWGIPILSIFLGLIIILNRKDDRILIEWNFQKEAELQALLDEGDFRSKR
ncbi:cytochrome c-type biogenesis protein L [Candidatus Photodesmus katoptron]|uniref:Cytochrome c-type biogenesis protein n=2 Tax=Candidatus Photodesmus anomalopis TaxID=28176 RepID=S3E0I5_9GAMM|nr:cytochrome C biogenesis protein [Candidatus Photodesmus katoptron Akat1]KEY90588.1 cytochrome c-type biogenesis protein L [Candidatus Photodesmus katoptron]